MKNNQNTIQTYLPDDLSVLVSYWYQPQEDATQTYPGCQESVEIGSVIVEGRGYEILDSLPHEVLKALEIECLNSWD
tara:strand:+ start:49893 stop:50123 length:231 start_codon:yes stop_codon:yes gene_type:complete